MLLRKSAAVLATVLIIGPTCAAVPSQVNASAQPATEQVALTAENSSLFLPASHEQYLELEAPSDAAFTDDYIAIADGKTLYLYARSEGGSYVAYEATGENATITKIQFVGTTLYFTVRGTYNSFWQYDCTTHTAVQIPSLNCSTFLIVNDMLYTAVISGSQTTLACRSLTDLQSEGTYLGTLTTGTEPWLAYADGTLYCTVSDQIYYPGPDGVYTDELSYYISNDTTINRHIASLCSDGTYLYFSSAAGLFRRKPGSEAVPVLLSDASEFCRVSALRYYNGTFHCIRDASVREIRITQDIAEYTDYEIAAASDSVNRLNDAADIARAGNLVVTADAGNDRISVYNSADDSFSTLPCENEPELVATDGEIIAYSAGTQVYTCNFASGETTFSSAQLTGTEVVGLSVLYGSTYYVKGNGTRGVVGGISVETSTSPKGMTADLYGNLYLFYASGAVRTYSEEEFLSQGMGADTGIQLPSDATMLRADLDGNLYCLSDGALLRNGTIYAVIDGSDFVYGTDTAHPISYALGFEDDQVYFVFGNYVVTTHGSTADAAGALSEIPTLSEIPVGDATEQIFSLHTQEGILVDIAQRAVGISIDLAALRENNAATFPYLSYGRSEQERQGILLADSQSNPDGYIAVLFSAEDGSCTAELFRAEAVIPSETAAWTESERQTRYLSSQISARYAPCMDASLDQTTLPRGTQVSLLGTLEAPDRTYALIEYNTDSRDVTRGWVPLSYLTTVSPTPNTGERYTLSYLKASPEGVIFTAEDGSRITITERTQVQLYDNGDGTYTARLADRTEYSATVTGDMLDNDSAEAIRIALIVILTVLALLIIGVYIFLLPREKYRKKGR